MTESEWQACTNPLSMLEFLKDRVSHRKLRLFAVACCRRVRHRMTDRHFYQIVDVAENYADGLADKADLTFARKVAWAAWTMPADAAARDAVDPDAFVAARNAARLASWANREVSRADELRVQAELLRDIFGFPFCSLPRLESTVTTWNDSTVRRLAKSVYQACSFDCLPILADALEEAGCADADILNHCRHTGEHVRGC